jgi:hypothetical protein
MKKILLVALYLLSLMQMLAPAKSVAGEFSGETTLEKALYFEKGIYGNNDESEFKFKLKPQYVHAWDDDRKVVTIVPFLSLNRPDNKAGHVDIREASFVGGYDDLEIRAGISKVFWGVTESKHLVDIVNQTDSVENIDGEDKLGQPMINATYTTEYGNFEAYVLPYFRERTFAGVKGRKRGAIVVNPDNALYSHEDEERHIDYALRWSHYLGDFEWGLSYFTGTDRAPLYVLDSAGNSLSPFYVQTEQVGVELQYIYESLLVKFEGLKKDSQFSKSYVSSVAGFEYTYSNVFGGMDIGLLYEHLYDERGVNSSDGINNHSFIGSRLAVNDENSAEFLFGVFANNETGDLSTVRLEGARRINNNWKWEVEMNWIVDNPKTSPFHAIRHDDYMQLSLLYYW